MGETIRKPLSSAETVKTVYSMGGVGSDVERTSEKRKFFDGVYSKQSFNLIS